MTKELTYPEMQDLMYRHGWIEEGIALWVHEDYPSYVFDGNGGDLLTAIKTTHWYQGDNFYGFVCNDDELEEWMENHK